MAPETLVHCPRCGGHGGEPGENFGDTGWYPCYFCGEEGLVTEAEFLADTQPQDVPQQQPPLWYDEASYARYQGDTD